MTILFVGGGTLGSVTPLLAIAEEFRHRGESEFYWWGTQRGPERELIEAAAISFRAVAWGKFRRYWHPRNLIDPFVIAWSFFVSLFRLARLRPSMVMGAGSFVQVPVMWAAWVLRIPCHVHQLDVRVGLANRLVTFCTTSITATFSSAQQAWPNRRVRVVGTPIRDCILNAAFIDQSEARAHFGFRKDRPVLLVLGGGTGSSAINAIVRSARHELASFMNILHVTGTRDWVDGERDVTHAWYRAFPLLTTELSLAYAAADLVVTRAGLGTLSELGVLGKAVVVVPMPQSHQEVNARILADLGAVEIWNQDELDTEMFVERTRDLMTKEAQRSQLSRCLVEAFPCGAASRIADMVQISHKGERGL
jgi:UDP-N-acetylglucosamine--N-acetylmuramyl-(pentapeptide) pyrophosphoryl-undecaprenol N-acetylglucosamine transferase